MSIITREVIVNQVWTLLVEGPCTAWITADDGDMTVAEQSIESGRGYPVRSGSEHRIELKTGDALYGMATEDDTPTIVNLLISTEP